MSADPTTLTADSTAPVSTATGVEPPAVTTGDSLGILGTFRELWRFRELLWNFTLREFTVRYRQTFVGALWAVMQPLSMTMVFFFISWLRPLPSDGKPYLIFGFGGMMQWTFFATSLSMAIPSLVGNSALVKKIYFPREVLPLSTLLVTFMDFCISFVMLIGLMLYYKFFGGVAIPVTPWLLLVPVIIAIQVIFALGLSLFFSAVNVTFRDVKYALPLILQLWMFASPVIYSANAVREKSELLYKIYMLNPMAPIVTSYRTVLLDGRAPEFGYLGLAAGVSVVVCLLAYIHFKRVDSRFADIL